MLTNIGWIAVFALGLFSAQSQPKWPPQRQPLPVVPEIGFSLVPIQIAHANVKVEIFLAGLTLAEKKFGERSAIANGRRVELEDARNEVAALQRVLDGTLNPDLQADAERRTRKALRHYREGLTMTDQELEARAKREHEEHTRYLADMDKRRDELIRIRDGKTIKQ